MALAQAKAEIRSLVERDFNRKSTRGRKRHARFLEDYTSRTLPAVTLETAFRENPNDSEMAPPPPARAGEGWRMSAEAILAPDPATGQPDTFTDDEVLPVFEANLDLPHEPAGAGEAPEAQETE